jgi:hypothetical protein
MLRGQDRYALFRLFSGKLGNEPAYSEIAALDPLRQPDRVVSRNRLLVAAHLARSNAAGLSSTVSLRRGPPCAVRWRVKT